MPEITSIAESREQFASFMLQQREEFFEELDRLGEPEVRANFESGYTYITDDQINWVRAWLRKREHERLIRREEQAAAALSLAERSAQASERAAAAAERAARTGILSAWIALATVTVTVLTGGFLAWLFGQ